MIGRRPALGPEVLALLVQILMADSVRGRRWAEILAAGRRGRALSRIRVLAARVVAGLGGALGRGRVLVARGVRRAVLMVAAAGHRSR